jgi:hypothetical protein
MMRTVLLSDICSYVNSKIQVEQVQLTDYVSTENLLQNKGGLSVANKLPSGKVTVFQAGDVLVSNIRPYFKKIWLADRSGGASNDVLVFRKLNDNVYEKYLYYILADDRFFAFSTASASGSKMPRGDKTQIMNYPVNLPPLDRQKKIADILSSLDEKIELNRRMNETLERLGQALFRHYFVDNPEAKDWESGRVSDVVRIYSGFAFKSKDFDINGKYGLVTIKNVQDGSFIKDCTDHLSEPPPDKTPEYVHLKSGDIILSLTGNVGRVCIVVGRDYLLNQRVAKLVSDESQAYTYFLFRSKIMKGRMVGISKGTAQKNLSPIETGKLKIKIPPTNIMGQFEENAMDLLNMIVSNNEQIQALTSLRDSLLPKLISGDIEL